MKKEGNRGFDVEQKKIMIEIYLIPAFILFGYSIGQIFAMKKSKEKSNIINKLNIELQNLRATNAHLMGLASYSAKKIMILRSKIMWHRHIQDKIHDHNMKKLMEEV